MEKGKKWLRWGIMLVAALFLFGACGSGTYDASGYVKSILDAQTQGEYDEYVELSESTQEEAEDLYKENIDTQMEGLEGMGLSDDLSDKYRELFVNVYKNAKYEVGEAEEGEDESFTVPVEVETYQLFDGVEEELATYQEEMIKELTAQMTETGEMPDEAEITEDVFQHMYELLNERVENPTYGEKTTIKVAVTKNADGIYEADEKDMEEIGRKIIDADAFMV